MLSPLAQPQRLLPLKLLLLLLQLWVCTGLPLHLWRCLRLLLRLRPLLL